MVGVITLLSLLVGSAESPQAIFDRRVLPILRSDQPSSCAECHLAGVDLKNYLLPSAEKTFLSLRDQGLVDLKSPNDSKILKWIAMQNTDSAPSPVQAQVRRQELAALSEWIKACCNDADLCAKPALEKTEIARAARPDAVVRHNRMDRVLDGFSRTVWAMRFRCMGCHVAGSPQAEKLKAEHGERIAWIKKSPEETLSYLTRETKLINTTEPTKSLLLLKPLGDVKHGGGKKFSVGDQGYKAYRTWLDDYAAVVTDRYRQASDLPRSSPAGRLGSEMWLKLTHTPDAWSEHLLQVDVHAWNPSAQTWTKKPVATSDRLVSGKQHVWQHTLTLLAEPGSPEFKLWEKNPILAPGRYRLHLYLDRDDRLKRDWQATFLPNDFLGAVEINVPEWRTGFRAMTAASAELMKRAENK